MPKTSQNTPPPPHRFIKDMEPGEQLADQVFLISKKDLRTTTNGGLYIHLVLADRSGQVLGRIWSASQQQYDTIPDGGFMRIRGRVESYKGNLQLIVDGMRLAEAGQFELADFVRSTERNVDEMWERVLAILRSVSNPHLLALVTAFVKDEKIMADFKKAPAAAQLHHSYIGGLLEHTTNVLELATRIFGEEDGTSSLYPEVSRDLVLVSIFLHDLGKTTELSYGTNFSYTNAGQLVGHITQAAIWIDQKIADVEQATGEPFPEDILNVLTHIILAHHGTHEFGSPKLPACPEAIVVNHLDNLDAKVQMFLEQIRSSRNTDSDWTEYYRPLETRIFKKDIMGIRPEDT